MHVYVYRCIQICIYFFNSQQQEMAEHTVSVTKPRSPALEQLLPEHPAAAPGPLASSGSSTEAAEQRFRWAGGERKLSRDRTESPLSDPAHPEDPVPLQKPPERAGACSLRGQGSVGGTPSPTKPPWVVMGHCWGLKLKP